MDELFKMLAKRAQNDIAVRKTSEQLLYDLGQILRKNLELSQNFAKIDDFEASESEESYETE